MPLHQRALRVAQELCIGNQDVPPALHQDAHPALPVQENPAQADRVRSGRQWNDELQRLFDTLPLDPIVAEERADSLTLLLSEFMVSPCACDQSPAGTVAFLCRITRASSRRSSCASSSGRLRLGPLRDLHRPSPSVLLSAASRRAASQVASSSARQRCSVRI